MSRPIPNPQRTALPTRRNFLRYAALAGSALLLPSCARSQGNPTLDPSGPPPAPPDVHIDIAEVDWELSPKKKIRTAAYNNQIPGKLLRVTEGKPVTIAITNNLDRAEIVHWHGQWIPSDVDGSMEEGSPMILAGASAQISFTPRPFGLHWYHTHTPAHRELKLGLYSGQFGVLLVEPRANPAPYDAEQFLVLHDWEPYFVSSDDGSEMVDYAVSSINGRTLGHGDPIQVKEGQRVLFHIVNASATEPHWLSLAHHQFQIVALDGRPVPIQAKVDLLRIGPAERISAIVTMDAPGIWILGETRARFRNAGMGVVLEYANRTGKPLAPAEAPLHWDYRIFGDSSPTAHAPDVTVPLVFTSRFEGHGALDRWMINGKSYPDSEPILLKRGLRHRLVFENRSKDDHPVHLHRHAFELVSVRGAATSGIFKDVVIVEAGSTVEADLVADNPGDTLFHCHQQDHMDSGFMTLFRYA
ncbi:MAG TPA: multicopper oxidase family protein [Terracidiphilus sp.]|nr:multicopper oxidase family protein [Terracidiphilus sp.]